MTNATAAHLAIWSAVTLLTAASGWPWLTAIVAIAGALLLRWGGRRSGGHRFAAPPPASMPVGTQARAEEAIAAAAQRWGHDAALRAILTAVSDGVVVLDRLDRVVATNDAGRELLDLPLAGDSTRPLPELVDWPQLTAALTRCRTDGGAQSFEAPFGGILVADGQANVRTLAVTVSVHAQGIGVVVLHDLTRMRQLESHRRDFVGNVSHELKTPLAAIRGFVETLIDDPDVPAQTRQHFMQRINRQVGRLSSLVADLLTLSRLDEERVAPPAQPVDPDDVVADVVRDLHPLAIAKGLALSATPADPPVRVVAERETLRQVVGNLVDNAIKYTAAGSVQVRVGAAQATCFIEVVDTGIGLSANDRSRVFERFYRVDKARSTELGGTGLGLSIVKNSVQAMGGAVGVESRPGQGSRFWVRLPLAKPS